MVVVRFIERRRRLSLSPIWRSWWKTSPTSIEVKWSPMPIFWNTVATHWTFAQLVWSEWGCYGSVLFWGLIGYFRSKWDYDLQYEYAVQVLVERSCKRSKSNHAYLSFQCKISTKILVPVEKIGLSSVPWEDQCCPRAPISNAVTKVGIMFHVGSLSGSKSMIVQSLHTGPGQRRDGWSRYIWTLANRQQHQKIHPFRRRTKPVSCVQFPIDGNDKL